VWRLASGTAGSEPFSLFDRPQAERRLNAMTETRGFNGGHLLVAFTAGAVAGAAVAYLTAPRSGKETREALQGWAKDVRDKASRIPHSVREAVERGKQAGKEAFVESYKGNLDRSDG